MKKDKEYFESVGYYSAMAQLLSFISADKNDSIDGFILSFELKDKHFREYLEPEDFSVILNDFENWNEAAQEMWVS
ncbi:hypothetical protein BCR24_15725 [Enterococcus ureilyticus]|uniref:Uncharacterized protein n=1 Tax=Enterococcus ureilyticus TaxID=1131292 RepID=A0A1E5HBW0_9ENTE|nr:hypothetical protein [Enterococcus ureilyticus]MBM7690571.1 hypothetical protein [Enterococcus ureilyticus]MBO0446328.1 hypothetical protein [Enterococcus ureilyticus]OEG22393.1 hypothetical protein BCR24_15725 [Enterococcus ureilyticus]